MADATQSTRAARLKRALRRIGVALGALAAAYAAGLVQNYLALRDTVKSLKLQTQVVSRLEARRDLDLALRELDRRNFGLAADRVHAAASQLQRSEPEGDLADLAKQIADAKLAAGDDMGKQRDQLLALIDRFDALQPPPKP